MLRHSEYWHEQRMLLAAGDILYRIRRRSDVSSLNDVKMRVFSQWGDDGMIQWLYASDSRYCGYLRGVWSSGLSGSEYSLLDDRK